MHLDFNRHPSRPAEFVASPTVWKLVDDFGTDHQVGYEYLTGDHRATDMFGGFEGRSARREILWRDQQDPDFFRAVCTEPEFHRACEVISCATTIGLSIEADLRIDFHIEPAWNEEAGIASYDRAAGARLEILSHSAWVGGEYASTVTVVPAALEEFCWQYLDLERAREAAGVQS